MQIESHTIEQLTDEHKSILSKYRKDRAFDVVEYVRLKTELLNNYLKRGKLTSVVVAMSGGIDSAVVLALCKKASETSGIRVVGVSLPSKNNVGVVNQTEGEDRSFNLAEKLGVEFFSIDVNNAVRAIDGAVFANLALRRVGEEYVKAFGHLKISDWAFGQLTPYTRTPFLYYITTILKEQGFPAVLVGTTNRDEGAYLGYVGKASDGMVDIQLISDLHKSEVRKVAEYLGVTQEILDITPTGDMFDGRCDEELFGATYDFVELYLQNRVTGKAADNLEEMHRYNAHKYFVGSPAVHLDIYESGVEGGWPLQFESKFWKKLNEFFPEDYDSLKKVWNDKDLYLTQIETSRKLIKYGNNLMRVVGVIKFEMQKFFQEYVFTNISGTNLYYVAEKIKHY